MPPTPTPVPPKALVVTPRLLVITLSNIGDLVLTTPVLEALSQAYPDQCIDIVGDRRSIELLAHAPYTGDLFPFNKRGGWRSHLAFLHRLRERRYTAVVDLRTAYLGYLLRADIRWRKPRRRRPDQHAVEEHFAALDALVPRRRPPPCQLHLPPAIHAHAAKLLAQLPGKRWLALAPGANWPGKKWPREHFRRLLVELAADFDAAIILGSADDDGDARAIASAGLPAAVLTGQTDLCTAAAVLARADAFVGNDSGLGHIAAAMNTPTLTLFGPGDPGRYRPWGAHTRIVVAPLRDLIRLEPTTVRAALAELRATHPRRC